MRERVNSLTTYFGLFNLIRVCSGENKTIQTLTVPNWIAEITAVLFVRIENVSSTKCRKRLCSNFWRWMLTSGNQQFAPPCRILVWLGRRTPGLLTQPAPTTAGTRMRGKKVNSLVCLGSYFEIYCFIELKRH